MAAIPTFGIDAASTINGAITSYAVTWYSEIEAENGDWLSIPFPAETSFGVDVNVNDLVKCTPAVDRLRSGGVECRYLG